MKIDCFDMIRPYSDYLWRRMSTKFFSFRVRISSLLRRKEQEESAVSRARKIFFAQKACDHAILLAANSFIAEFWRFFRARSASHCFERRQSDDEFRAPLVLDGFEAAAEPSEGSVVKIEPALAERSRIHPFAA